jgi:hypothetical protein
MNYPQAVVIDIGDNLEPSIEAEVVGIDNSPHWDMAQRKLMCCLSISIVIFIMIVLGYSLSRS